MSLITPDDENGGPDEDLSRARQHLRRAIGVFQDMTREVELGNIRPEAETAKMIRALSNATQTLYNEKQKIDGSLKKQSGIAYQYAIDFDAARREIRRRMALLRGAGSGGDISE